MFDDDCAPPPVDDRGVAVRSVGSRVACGVVALAALALAGSLATKQVTVQAGDTLSGIAAVNGSSVAVIAAQNGLTDPNRIVAGDVLQIPGTSGEIHHTVRAGDTLTKIAKVYGTTVPAIVARNGLSDADRIRIGRDLVIPLAPAASPAAPPTTVASPQTAAHAAAPTPTTPAPASPTTASPTTAPPTTVAPVTVPPTTAATTTTSGGAPAVTPSPSAGGVVSTNYRVQAGDTLASIAARFHTTVTRLSLLNAIGPDEPLVTGALVFIPPEGQAG
ncbi:MAG TPA: LysM domain-containing protein [Acidimicrobiales bacterium]|nr:LysM domain-containing protein [Acidimicrobiales bacterium]